MKWEDQKNAIRNAVENVFKIGEEKGVRKLSFSVEIDPDYPPIFLYTVDSVLIAETLKEVK